MARFNFEKDLEHQNQAVKAVLSVFKDVEIIKDKGLYSQNINLQFNIKNDFKFTENIGLIQEHNGIKRNVDGNTNIIDIMMETGTGKTYTYTKTIFELNKQYGIYKYIIVVPTVPIKAGTIEFLKSDSAIEHFREQYNKSINLHIVESKKSSNKSKKSYMPTAVLNFVNSGDYDKNRIQVLIINSGMINSKTMKEKFDKNLFDKYDIPFEAIAATKAFMIIDEPHKFPKGAKTWENIQLMKPQIVIRYGATFKKDEIHNLVYKLTAVDSFNRNLIKGIKGYVTEYSTEKNTLVRFINSDGKEATLELINGDKRKVFKLNQKENLEKVHSEMNGLFIEKLNKTTLLLSNGLELTKGDKINPFSYSETLQEKMIYEAIKHHFENELEYLTRDVKIKPLTLFFIDNIDEYRNKEGYIRKTVEKYIQLEARKALKKTKDIFYKDYLKKTLNNIALTHGGYFSKDNNDKDEAIEKELNEILHDKQKILDLENPRRFIFSKWTLREGWDNPNIFQICKLRSSGSEISKLQEVGRGLRLPVNEYGNRVKDEDFDLNYFVDFTESDFVDKLKEEINENSDVISNENNPKELTKEMINIIVEKYNVLEEELLEKLDEDKVITRTNKFKDGGFDYIKKNYPLIFKGVNSNKVRNARSKKEEVSIRVEKYSELKALWEKLNEKVILEYKISNEKEFKNIFVDFLINNTPFYKEKIQENISRIKIQDNKAIVFNEISVFEEELQSMSTMKYSDFVKSLADEINMNFKTLHESFKEIKESINNYLNQQTIRIIKEKFNKYLLYNAINKIKIEYKKVTQSIHPTKFTKNDGNVKNTIFSSDIGVKYSDEKVAENYFLDKLFYDSDLERKNIIKNIKEVVVFTKIPKNSIKIPISGGETYSPDFAYVLKYKNNQEKLYFIVETKNADSKELRESEKQKIKHAELFFGDTIKIKFETQFKNEKITELIHSIYNIKS